MLMTMTTADASGRETHFEQRMKIPGHGFLDVAASLDQAGMRTCLREHLTAGRLRSAMAQAKSYALPRLMIGLADKDATPHSTSFKVGEATVRVAVGA